ncbi:hypothetical protein P170DRAFT_512960 [Aspergillus steynii IBT 23096]|uniref:C2H2-type domain-containing protein n=1 Tax=Aspergillus steynii IBT 23096 TaxID=1392250 RepID=A0A2I2FW12_9EURO|nr:uncharacterized protein P170DRAFT_512960 [Aspergillus steynii IBT 23096]PLB44818.1 hypothetical protein P170DRAFT_512960 [Aspergillus steynii IBT 23096]
MSWDLNLCMKPSETPIVPFFYYVSPQPDQLPSPSLPIEPCDGFFTLPLEIHQMVFELCDPPTLFPLMHTCSYTRRQCSNLFWRSLRNVCFQLEPMDSVWDGQFCLLYHCPSFASHVTQIDISLNLDQMSSTKDVRQGFWDRIRELFPSVSKVVLTCPNHIPNLLAGDIVTLHAAMALVFNLAPPGITPLITLEELDTTVLWSIDSQGDWHAAEDPWTPLRVLLPPKKLPPGILSDFIRAWQITSLIFWGQLGLRWLRRETYARFPTNGQIMCPAYNCDHTFRDRQSWRRHIFRSLHDPVRLWHREYPLSCAWDTPAEVKTILDARQQRIDRMSKEARALTAGLRHRAGRVETTQHKTFKRELRDQMILYGYLIPGMELKHSTLWNEADELFYADHYDHEQWEENNIDPDDFNEEDYFEEHFDEKDFL